jgi:dTDP-4-amino-4,6-dideoxygalactose transaminase
MLNTRKILFPLQNVSAKDAAGMIGAAIKGLLVGTNGTKLRTRFEKEFENQLGEGTAVAFPSGRSALAALLVANGVKPGNEVLVTGFTCDAVAQAVVAIGAIPRWVDIDVHTLAMNPVLAEESINDSTQAIIVQHSYGIPAQLEKFQEIATRHSIALIEDSCLALGSQYADGKVIGTTQHDSFWSFEVTKTISAGWGGIAMVKNSNRASTIQTLRDHAGSRSRIDGVRALVQTAITALSYRSRFSGWMAYLPAVMYKVGLFSYSDKRIGGMTSQTPFESYGAAGPDDTWKLLSRQLTQLSNQIRRLKSNNNIYFKTMESIGIELPESWTAETTVLLRIPILVKNREAFEAHMWNNNIDTGRWFDSPVTVDNTSNTFGYIPCTCPIGEGIASSITNLPTHAGMNQNQVESSARAMGEYFADNPGESTHMNDLLASDRSKSGPSKIQ